MFSNKFKTTVKIIGIMTGTSIDAIDLAFVDFLSTNQLNIISYDEIKISKLMKEKILTVIKNKVHISEISALNYAVSEMYYQTIIDFTQKHKIDIKKCDAISIHGQTVWHQPEPVNFAGSYIPSTLQLGNASYLAKKTSVKVISDFRSGDIALGGQGAPLVPVFDRDFLFSGKNTFALNIGGIANITFLPESGREEEIIAFDTGPGNVLIDTMMNHHFDMQFDKNGEIARKGNIIESMLNELLSLDYFKKEPPKSTGRELFNLELLENLNYPKFKPEDLIRTLTEFTAITIANGIESLNEEEGIVIASGGGVKNIFLMDLLKSKINQKFVLITSDEAGIPSDAKEAICFAYLGYLNLNNLPGNLPSVTGASRKTILGSVSEP